MPGAIQGSAGKAAKATRANETTPRAGDDDSTDDAPQGFEDMVQEIAAAALPSQPAAGSGRAASSGAAASGSTPFDPDVPGAASSGTAIAASAISARGLFPGLQTITPSSLHPDGEGVAPETPQLYSTGGKAPNKKEPGSGASATLGRSGGATAVSTAPAPALDVVMPAAPVRAKFFDLAEGGGGQQTVHFQSHSQPEPAATLLPEAALTVSIRSIEPAPTSVALPNAPAVATASAQAGGPTETAQPESVVGAPAGGDQIAVPAVAGLPAAPVPAAEAQLKKITTDMPAAGSSAVVSGDVATQHGAQTTAIQNLQTQNLQTQDLQAKPEQARSSDAGVPRNDAPRPPATAPEATAAEKPAAQPLKSVSLEFTPDGAREVRVRLSERAGEVHVSLHSSDPAVTKNLRDGVTDLATVLANAGYDAKAWTSGRQQQQNPQQQDEPVSRQRGSGSGEEAENFDSALQGSAPSLIN